jgi:type 1 glutamine amidotransferase
MQRSVTILTAISLCAAVLAMAASAARAEVPADEMTKIEAACPKTAPAKPAKARKILVYSHCGGFNHAPAIERGKIVLAMMGEKTGAYTTVVSDDLSNFEPDKLKQFDLVVLNNTTGELFETKGPDGKPDTAKLRESFMSWVKGGGAVFGIHAATDCSYKWQEFGEMMGGWFSGHPWNEKVGVRNDDPTNPINAAFDGKGFEIADEIYTVSKGDIYSREKQRVLLSIDPAKTDTKKAGRADGDVAVSWIKPCGKGRVFYCSLGHRNEIFSAPAILGHYLAGMQWAMGDLKGVDATPKPLVTK